MNIILNFLGLIQEHIGEKSVTFTFEKDVCFGDVLVEIHRRYKERLPTDLWDPRKLEFRPGILCVGEGRDLENKDTMLKDGEMIFILVQIAGG